MLIDHDCDFNEAFNTEPFLSKMNEACMGLYANNIQHYSIVPVGWLLNAHIDTMDCQTMTKLMQYNSRFCEKNIPVECKLLDYKPHALYTYDKGAKRIKVAGIFTANEDHYIKTTILACKDVFNRKLIRSAKTRPEGSNCLFVYYLGESRLGVQKLSTILTVEAAFKFQLQYMKECAVIIIQGIANIDRIIDYNNEQITLRQVLTSLRTSVSWETPIFTQVHYCQKIEEFIGICHKNEKQEALLITQNLVTLCIAHFGENARGWFDLQAIEMSQSVQYDPETRKMIENNQCDYSHLIKDSRYRISDAEYQAIVDSDETDLLQEILARYKEEASDSDEKEDTKKLEDMNIQ